jgi:hypothetical protein
MTRSTQSRRMKEGRKSLAKKKWIELCRETENSLPRRSMLPECKRLDMDRLSDQPFTIMNSMLLKEELKNSARRSKIFRESRRLWSVAAAMVSSISIIILSQ